MGFLSALLGFVGGLIGNIFNYDSTKQTNKQNKETHQQDLDFQKAQTEAQWERDDTVHQREVADLEAAGLSPLANMQGSPSSQALGASSPIAAQAPQIDVNGLMNAMLRKEEHQETVRHNKVQEGYKETELGFQATEINQKYQELDIENKKVDGQLRYQNNLINMQAKELEELSRHNQEIEDIENAKTEEQKRANKENEKIQQVKNQLSEASEKSKRYAEELKKELGGRQIPYQFCTTYEEYTAALENYNNNYSKLLDELSQGTRTASSESNAGGGSVGAGNSQVFNLNLSGEGSHSEYNSSDVSKYQEQKIHDFYSNNPYPIYEPDFLNKVKKQSSWN